MYVKFTKNISKQEILVNSQNVAYLSRCPTGQTNQFTWIVFVGGPKISVDGTLEETEEKLGMG